jgi:flagellar hook-associated protein 2
VTTRITGTVSGLDTDALVKATLTPEQTKLDTFKQTKQTVTWQREAYQDINTKLLTFRNTDLSTFNMDKVLRARTVALSGDTTAVSATANGGAPVGSMTVKVTQLATATTNVGTTAIANASFSSTSTLSSQSANMTTALAKTSYSFTVNGTSISVDTTKDSLSDVISRINKNTTVNAYYDSTTRKISLTSKAMGASSAITIGGTDPTFMTSNLQTGSSTVTAGVDANVQINGIATTRNSNTFTENGVNITLNSVSTGTSTITVSPNSDSIVSSVKDFVAKYNTMLATLEDKTGEPKYSDYKPLTDAQQTAMSATQITDWNTKAKSGLLHHDSIMDTAINKMRNAASSIVNTGSTTYKTLASIGITTGDYTEQGKLYLDEDKLKAAIAADPEAVANIFSQKASTTSKNVSDNGFTTRLYSDLYNSMKDISTRAGTSLFSSTSLNANSTLGLQVSQLGTQITDQTTKLNARSDQLYKQYANLETTLNQLKSQSSALTAFSSLKTN